MVWVAPNSRAQASFRLSVSTAMILRAPTSAAPAIAASPTPPQPMTATVSSRPTLPVLIAAPEAGHHAAAQQAGDGGVGLGVDLGALALVHQRLVGERPDAQRGREFGAVGQGHLLGGVERVEAVPGAAALAGPALPADGAPVEDDEVADLHVGDTLADGFDGAGGLMAEQERVLVVDAALAVGQVGVAYAARDDVDDHLARARGRGSRCRPTRRAFSCFGRSHRALSDSWATT